MLYDPRWEVTTKLEIALAILRGKARTTLTKRMAEDLTEYLHEAGLKVRYMHSDVETLERIELIRELRLGVYDVLVAVRANKGSLKNRAAVIAAMRKANFDSIRGPFKYNVNHMPIQDFYLLQAVKGGKDGAHMQIKRKVFHDHKDSYYKDCKMK